MRCWYHQSIAKRASFVLAVLSIHDINATCVFFVRFANQSFFLCFVITSVYVTLKMNYISVTTIASHLPNPQTKQSAQA